MALMELLLIQEISEPLLPAQVGGPKFSLHLYTRISQEFGPSIVHFQAYPARPFQLSQEPTKKKGPRFEARGAERALAPFFAAAVFSLSFAPISFSAALRNFQVTWRPNKSHEISSCMQSEGSAVIRKFRPCKFPGPSTPSPFAVG